MIRTLSVMKSFLNLTLYSLIFFLCKSNKLISYFCAASSGVRSISSGLEISWFTCLSRFVKAILTDSLVFAHRWFISSPCGVVLAVVLKRLDLKLVVRWKNDGRSLLLLVFFLLLIFFQQGPIFYWSVEMRGFFPKGKYSIYSMKMDCVAPTVDSFC